MVFTPPTSCESESKIPIDIPIMIPATIPWFPVHSWVYHNVCFLLSTSTRHGCHRTDGSHRGGRVVFCAVSQRWRARLTWGDPTSFFLCSFHVFSHQISRNGTASLKHLKPMQCKCNCVRPYSCSSHSSHCSKAGRTFFLESLSGTFTTWGLQPTTAGSLHFQWLAMVAKSMCIYIYIHTYIYMNIHM